jgi:hypothetical protein
MWVGENKRKSILVHGKEKTTTRPQDDFLWNMFCIRPKKICGFPVSRPYLAFGRRNPDHRVDKTYRDVTDHCKHCGRLRYHVPTFFQAIGRKLINCACSASLKWVVIRSSSNQMHASSNLPIVRTKKVGTRVTSQYVSTLWWRSWDNFFTEVTHLSLLNLWLRLLCDDWSEF